MSEKSRKNRREREGDSRDLMLRYQRGETEVLDRLIELNDPILRSYAKRVLGKAHEHLVDEVVSIVYIRVWTAPSRFDPAKGSVRAYLTGIAKHQARRLRQTTTGGARNPDLVGDADGEVFVSREMAPEDAAETDEERDRVQGALSRLDEEERGIARGLGEGKSHREIGSEIGKSHVTVGKRRPRILDKIVGLFTQGTD